MSKQWTIKSSELETYKIYLNLTNILVSKEKKLTFKEIEIMSILIHLNYKYINIPVEERMILIISKENRKKICLYLKCQRSSIDNVISSLYKKGYLSKDKGLRIKVTKENNEINFNLKLIIEDGDELKL